MADFLYHGTVLWRLAGIRKTYTLIPGSKPSLMGHKRKEKLVYLAPTFSQAEKYACTVAVREIIRGNRNLKQFLRSTPVVITINAGEVRRRINHIDDDILIDVLEDMTEEYLRDTLGLSTQDIALIWNQMRRTGKEVYGPDWSYDMFGPTWENADDDQLGDLLHYAAHPEPTRASIPGYLNEMEDKLYTFSNAVISRLPEVFLAKLLALNISRGVSDELPVSDIYIPRPLPVSAMTLVNWGKTKSVSPSRWVKWSRR